MEGKECFNLDLATSRLESLKNEKYNICDGLLEEIQREEIIRLIHELNFIKDGTQTIIGTLAELEGEALKKMRDIDDKIIYTLNSKLPTESFKGQVDKQTTCQDLYNELTSGHSRREEAIKSCIRSSAESLKQLKEARESHGDNIEVDKKFKSEQRKLRILQSELNVEEIVKERSYKAFNEKCRAYFHAGVF